MHNNLNNDKKEHENRGKQKKKTKRENLDNNEKEQLRKDDKKRKMDKRFQTSDERNSIFSSVQICSMFDPSVLTTSDLSNRVDANFSNHIIYVYCCKNERSSLDLENIVFLCQQT